MVWDVMDVSADGDGGRGWDFFISYTQADRAWAEWIAWVLEEDGHRVLIQAWDFVPGSNWIRSMEAGIRDASRMIAVLSGAYLKSVYGGTEWQAALAADPDGTGRKLLIVRVAECERPGLLAGVVGVDLFGLEEPDAQDRLRNMVRATLSGRAKPSERPAFPGPVAQARHAQARHSEPEFPGESSFPGESPRSAPSGRASAHNPETIPRRPDHIPSRLVKTLPAGPKTKTEMSTAEMNTGQSELGIHAVAFTPNGRLLAAGKADHTVEEWHPANMWSRGSTLGGHSGIVRSIAFSPDGALLASASDDATVLLRSPGSEGEKAVLRGHTGPVRSIAFSPDGSLLASAGDDTTIQLWRTSSYSTICTLTGHGREVRCVAFSPDGTMLASASADGSVRLWETKTGFNLQTLTDHGDIVTAVAFSLGGALLVSGSSDGRILCWDTATWRRRSVVRPHPDGVSALARSPDGTLFASAGGKDPIQLWKPISGRSAGTLTGHTGSVRALAFSPDGTLLASAGSDESIYLWR
jgi:WD40 repeat protein